MLNINQYSLESPPKELPVHALRWEVQKIIEHYAEVFQCPKDFITSAVFGIVGTMCGRHVTIFDGKYRNHPTYLYGMEPHFLSPAKLSHLCI